MRRSSLATLTGLEPATSAVTGRRANQLRHRASHFTVLFARERTLVDAMQITQISHHQIDRALLSCGFCAAAAPRTGPARPRFQPAGRSSATRPSAPASTNLPPRTRPRLPHAPLLAAAVIHPSSPPPSQPHATMHSRTRRSTGGSSRRGADTRRPCRRASGCSRTCRRASGCRGGRGRTWAGSRKSRPPRL